MRKLSFLFVLMCGMGYASAGQTTVNSVDSTLVPFAQRLANDLNSMPSFYGQRRNSDRGTVTCAPYVQQTVYVVEGIILAPGEAVYRSLPVGPPSWFMERASGSWVLKAAAIEALPVVDLNDQLGMLPGFYQQRYGGELNVAGARRMVTCTSWTGFN